jgi:serine/threonine protein kinase
MISIQENSEIFPSFDSIFLGLNHCWQLAGEDWQLAGEDWQLAGEEQDLFPLFWQTPGVADSTSRRTVSEIAKMVLTDKLARSIEGSFSVLIDKEDWESILGLLQTPPHMGEKAKKLILAVPSFPEITIKIKAIKTKIVAWARQYLNQGSEKIFFKHVYLDTSDQRKMNRVFTYSIPRKGKERSFLNEIELLQKCAFIPGIRHVGEVVVNSSGIVKGAFFEYCEQGDLFAYLHRHQLTQEQKGGIALDILRTVAQLHRVEKVHCDIKSENILLTCVEGKLRARLADFGHSRNQGTKAKLIGTRRLIPPEGFSEPVHPSRDMWSCGLLLTELFLGVKENPFRHLNDPLLAYGLTIEKLYKNDLLFILPLLQIDPLQRPTAEQCFRQLWSVQFPAIPVPTI